MAGYSGTPLAKKLGIKDDFRAALLHVPEEVRIELRGPLAKCQILNLKSKKLDFIFFFAQSLGALESELMAAVKVLAPAGMVWISWPKKSSGVATDQPRRWCGRGGLVLG
jgi:hypothetical protein